MKLILSKILKQAELPSNITPQDVNSLLRKPEVQAYSKELENRKNIRNKSRSWKIPTTAAGLGLAGYGLKRLGDAAITPEDRRTVENLSSLGAETGNPPDMSLKDIIHHPSNAIFPSGVTPSKNYRDSSELFWFK